MNDVAALLVGAGMSQPCGLPSWKELLRMPLAEIKLDIEKETDLLSAAQYYANVKGRRSDLTQHIINLFTKKNISHSDSHALLASLPIKYVWTTNYDTLLEDAYRACVKKVDVKRKPEDLCYSIPGRDVIIHKMHGDITIAGDITLISDDYESYHRRNELFSTAFKNDIATKTFLFIGFSMSDPNILGILGQMKEKLGNHVRQHFCIYKNIHKDDIGENGNLEYARTREELWIANLKRYGIEIVRVNSYKEIDNLLKTIKQYILSKSVFISGSAEDYGVYSKEDAEFFIHQLSYKLVEKGYRVVSGFGKGVGDSVINGVLSYAYSQGQNIGNRLLTLPFPQNIKNPDEREKRWKKYREDMISRAGNAIFIFGNKYSENKLSDTQEIVLASGVRQEFAIAKAQGLKVYPIVQTGYVAKELWSSVSKELEHYYESVELLQTVKIMNDVPADKVDELVTAIINCIDASQNL